MHKRQSDSDRHRIGLVEKDFMLLTRMYTQLSLLVEFLCFLLEKREENAFVIVLLEINTDEVDNAVKLLSTNKRETDLLVPIDTERRIYALLCQGTQIEGGYRFAERLISSVLMQYAQESYFVELEVKSLKYDVKTLLFMVMELYLKAKKENQKGQIVYKSLY